ncbi:caspase family protein [bacterium]|nr:MAG: caspase family protein [bacterium]
MNALALVIGNANYTAEKDRLLNAVNDADDIGMKLLNLGFIVNKSTDCSRETFDREVRRFGEELKKFDVGLFYFSGHGLQIEGNNYLTSIDTSFADAVSAKHTAFPLDEIIDYMQQANPIIKILILDACRDNPLPNQFRSVQGDGLAPIHAPKGTIIAFSTSPGEKAMDYGSGRNSIYTGSLLNHIDDTNIPIEDFFKRVRTSVFTLSNGKQTSWEHTSLIGNFYFNSGQLIHSVELPYKNEYIADENFQSTGSDIDNIIEDLKSHNFYTQQPAFRRLSQIPPNTLDDSSLFLLGRNILQTAIGGEFTANSIIKNLDKWLLKYFTGQQNHVLNGILFEMYFNSKGQFRQNDFKNELIDEIFKLQINDKYKNSFEFLVKQLAPFHEFLFYIPSDQPTALPIEVKFETYDYDIDDRTLVGHKMVSVKHEEVELLEPYEDNEFNAISVNYEQCLERLHKELCVPKNMLRLSMNVQADDIKIVYMPWTLKLTRQDK